MSYSALVDVTHVVLCMYVHAYIHTHIHTEKVLRHIGPANTNHDLFRDILFVCVSSILRSGCSVLDHPQVGPFCIE